MANNNKGRGATGGVEPVVTAIPYETYRAQNALKAQLEGRAADLDETVPGGFYLNDAGEPVDANGNPIKSDEPDAEPAGDGGGSGDTAPPADDKTGDDK